MATILQLAPPAAADEKTDPEIIDALEALLVLAKGPGLPGFAYVALHHGTHYTADVLGCVHQHPLLTLGICRELEDAVRSQTRKKT